MMARDVPSFDQLVADRKKAKRSARRHQLGVAVIFCVVSLLLGFGFYAYFNSEMAHPASYFISGNRVLTDETILKRANLDYQTVMVLRSAGEIKDKLKSDPLIEDAQVVFGANRTVSIHVKEKGIKAIWMDQAMLILSDGTILTIDLDYAKAWLQAPGIYGYASREALDPLIEALKDIPAEALGNVSEIHLSPTSYDETYVKVIMQDGNRVFTGLATLDMLSDYPTLVNVLTTKNACLFFDEMTRTAFSRPCGE